MIENNPLSLTLLVSLIVAVVLLTIRVLLMQRIQKQRQRENRQESERLKSLIGAYRALAGSFSPGDGTERPQLDEALADIVLFGSLHQVTLAAECATALVSGGAVNWQPLIDDLRADLRQQLGLDSIPRDLVLPPLGPAQTRRTERAAGGRDGAGKSGASGAAGGAGGGAIAGGAGIGAGLVPGAAGGGIEVAGGSHESH